MNKPAHYLVTIYYADGQRSDDVYHYSTSFDAEADVKHMIKCLDDLGSKVHTVLLSRLIDEKILVEKEFVKL